MSFVDEGIRVVFPAAGDRLLAFHGNLSSYEDANTVENLKRDFPVTESNECK